MRTAVEIALECGYVVNPAKELTVKEAKRLTLNKNTARETYVGNFNSMLGTGVWTTVGMIGTVAAWSTFGTMIGAGALLFLLLVPSTSFFFFSTSLTRKQETTFRLIQNEIVIPAAVESVSFQKLQKALSRMEITAADSIKTDIVSDLRRLQWTISMLENSRNELKRTQMSSTGLSPVEEAALERGIAELDNTLHELSERTDIIVDNVAALPTLSEGNLSKIVLAEQAVEQARSIAASSTGRGSLELTAVYRQALEQV